MMMDADERKALQHLLKIAQAFGAGDGLAFINKVKRAEVVLAKDV